MMITLLSLSFFRTVRLLCIVWVIALAPLLAAPRDLTFIVVSDTHYGLNPVGDETVPLLVDKMNAIAGTAYPAAIGGQVGTPRGVLHIGDVTNDGKKEQWAMFVRDYGLTGEDGRLKYPIYECYGNHDGGPGSAVRDGIRARNPKRLGLTAISTNGIHYCWNWDGILFVNLGVAPGSTTHPYDPEYSMEFLEETLKSHVEPGQPLVLMHHFGFDKGHSLSWWPEERRVRYHELIRDQNVIGILQGHAHESFIDRWQGIDIYHPPHYRQKDAKNNGPVTHGFFVFHITEDELTVAERKLDDTWGITSRKKLGVVVGSQTIREGGEIRNIAPPEKGFFSKELGYHGIPIKAHRDVSDQALHEAYQRLDTLLEHQPVVLANLVRAGAALHIIGKNQVTSDLPEHRHMKGKKIESYGGMTVDERTRGLGGLLTSCGEENLLRLDSDRYIGRDICIHEFAHNIRNAGISAEVRKKFNEQRERSLKNNLWVGSYAGSNPDEFFAELTMWYFGSFGDMGMKGEKPGKGREGLIKYDPEAFALFDAFYSGRLEGDRN